MPKILEIAELGHPVLRDKAKQVHDTGDPELAELIQDMIVTAEHNNGVGIAAPQVYQSKRVFIISSNPNERYPNAPEMEPTAIINPEIISYSEELVKDWEGCLSIPGIRALVPRFTSIRAKYETLDGESIEDEFEGFIARIFQHEFDHIEGIVFLDRIDDNSDIVTDKEYVRITHETGDN